MPETTLDPKYSPSDIESRLYTWWEEAGFFRPVSDKSGKQNQPRYVIVIPPPNVTGILHMGHALNNSIQDVMIRWNRMRGIDTLWVPGIDHAGIATQNVVEKKLKKEGKRRDDVGREKFLEMVWEWKEAHGGTIFRQLRRLGASCDWTRERFTMDEGLSRAVRECFVKLHERGLIYRGNYIINWCPRCQTALSDEEAAHKDVQGGLYHIKYRIKGAGEQAEKIGEDHIVIATTRPETLLGDTAVAVNPEDGRYKGLIGKMLVLPVLGREIPVIADSFVDPEFGTGMVKVTPAHDPNDFEMGLRHDLPQINVMHPDGKINEHGGPYNGMDRFAARKQLLKDLEAEGLFIQRQSHLHAVGHCYRCDTVVEPYLSKQWFVKMKPLADKALQSHAQGKTVFYPDRWTKVYTNWLSNIRDWCISRQIWWGHQIPVWYDEAGDYYVACDEASAQSQAREKHGKDVILTQDPDVLDTWFSSWLWPFSTLGWPEKKEDLAHFYPTSDLITAPEIIFFWVARMIMSGLEFMDEVPFSRIYLHGTVRAEGGLKMSKSLGNSIDPLEVIEEIGADALRFSLIMLSAQDVYLSRQKFEMGRNFTNKIWNAARFSLMNLEGFTEGSRELDVDFAKLPVSCRWMLSSLERGIREADGHLHQFGMAQSSAALYHLTWNDFCDWFIELTKPTLTGGDSDEKRAMQKVLFYVMEKLCLALHPFMPFITEEIWQQLKSRAADKDAWPETIQLAVWPLAEKPVYQDTEAEKQMDRLQRIVTSVRDIRAKLNIPPKEKLKVVVVSKEKTVCETVSDFSDEISTLGNLSELSAATEFERSKSWVGNSFADLEVFLFVEGVIDFEKEKARVQKKVAESEKYVHSLGKKLENQNFVKNAPEAVVKAEQAKLAEAREVLKSYQEHLRMLES